MRFDPIAVRTVQTWLPPVSESASEAVSLGRLDEETAQELGYDRLPVADLAPPEMAVLAARAVLDRTQVGPGELDLVLHAWIHYQGHDMWSPAHYIAHQLGAQRAIPLGLQQLCNGGAAAVELTVALLAADPEVSTALITTADRFAEPGFDRWAGDYGIAYGDGATAAVLTRPGAAPADLHLFALATAAAPELELMHRGDDAFSPAARWHSSSIDMRRTKKAYLRVHGLDAFVKAGHDKVGTVVERCLADAGVAGDDPRLRTVLLPRLGRKILDQAYVPVVRELTAASVELPGRDTGHLGAGDMMASLAELTGTLDSGDLALVVNAGAGFTWSCLLVGRP